MGHYDHLYIADSLNVGIPTGEDFVYQTKSFNKPCYRDYKITVDGELYKHERVLKTKDDETAKENKDVSHLHPGVRGFGVTGDTDKEWIKINYTGKINVSGRDIELIFENGELVDVCGKTELCD